MRIRNFYMVTFFIVALVFSQACNKDILDIAPSSPTEESYFQTGNQFKRAAYGIYAKFSSIYGWNNNNPALPILVSPGDDITVFLNVPWDTFEGASSDNWKLTQYWSNIYGMIHNANALIQKFDELEDVNSLDDPDVAKQAVGEAYFLRSWAYLQVMNVFGKNIPLIKEVKLLSPDVSKEDLLYPSIGSYSEILSSCIDDAIKAAGFLPAYADIPDIEKGRISLEASKGLLGKLYMYSACYNKDNGDYTKALAAFNEISASFGLVANFADNFSPLTENNMESLFEFQASMAPELDNPWLPNGFGISVGSMSFASSLYDNSDWWISTWGPDVGGLFVPSDKLLSVFDATDPRFDASFEDQGWSGDPFVNGYKIVKFSKSGSFNNAFPIISSTNFRLIRMADIYLLKAEALLKTGNTSGAIAEINKIRSRARNSVTPASPIPADRSVSETNTSTVMAWIMEERMVELAGEGHRWGDLKRWDQAGDIDLSTWGASEFSSYNATAFDFSYPNDLVYPIPSTETNNNPNIIQNPGY